MINFLSVIDNMMVLCYYKRNIWNKYNPTSVNNE